MRRRTKIIAAALGTLLLVAAVVLVPTLWFKPYSPTHQYTRIFATFVLRSPMTLSQLQFLPAWLDFHSDELDDRSLAFQEKQERWLDRELGILRRYRRSGIRDTLSHDILDWFMADASDGIRWRFHTYPLNQMFGEQNNLPSFMLQTHRIERTRDARNYVARLEGFERYFDQVLEGVRERERRGVVPPRFVVQRVLGEMRDFIAPPVTEHVLYTHLRARLDSIPDVRPRDRDAILARAEAALTERVYPGYRKLIAQAEQLEGVATVEDGVWKLPEGEAFYQYNLRQYTTTDLTADQIHDMGLQEVARIEAEMRAILEAEGYRVGGSVGATLAEVFREPRFGWPDSDEGRAAILAEYQRIVDEIDAGLAPVFNVRPAVGVRVERIPPFKEATSALAYYNRPALDGSRPGVFYANLRDVAEHKRPRMRTLAYHEAIPGHHFQIGIAQELTGMPFFRKVVPFTAYTEGWALYAEQVAAEHGFQDDPYDRLGYLSDQMMRACRLVVDTGIHARRWTREQAIEYMRAYTGMPESEATAEIERYIVMPGQATAYMVGRLKILELRERARQRLGERFEVREFHDVVLKNGAVPLTILERIVEDWIAARG
jgi:uncharacterized protein (DUF885 family)